MKGLKGQVFIIVFPSVIPEDGPTIKVIPLAEQCHPMSSYISYKPYIYEMI